MATTLTKQGTIMLAREKITQYRSINGINQKKLANKLGITPQYLSRLECGDQPVSANIRYRLNALDEEFFTLEALFGKEANGVK